MQRLRKQAKDVGNLESSSQMLVETEVQEGQEVVVLKAAETGRRLRAAVRPADGLCTAGTGGARRRPGDDDDDTETAGHSTASMVTTGVLAFGAGILVSEVVRRR